jgi:hypothetical protein
MLTSLQRKLVFKTISSNAFYLLVKDALEQKYGLSVIRMADGERALLQQCEKGDDQALVDPPHGHGQDWLERYGVAGIPKWRLQHSLNFAAKNCTYFSPSITGVTDPAYSVYNLFPARDVYVDNFFPDQFTMEQKESLFKTAGHVLFIHGNPHTADSMQLRTQANLGVKVSYLRLTNWREAPGVVDAARKNLAPLVLFASGPASKWIGPAIEKGGYVPKVTLDLGHGADLWTMNHLPIDRPKAEAFHAEWAAREKLILKSHGIES